MCGHPVGLDGVHVLIPVVICQLGCACVPSADQVLVYSGFAERDSNVLLIDVNLSGLLVCIQLINQGVWLICFNCSSKLLHTRIDLYTPPSQTLLATQLG
jgi:hypothetical protein